MNPIAGLALLYFGLGFFSGLIASAFYDNRESLAIGFFWPLVWIFGIVKLFIITVSICWHMIFSRK